MKILDFRSDTVTQPTPEMREAMAQAQVGDDVYGEDPTINRLQEISAEIAGMQSAIFVPSGTMGNLASILAHCQRGDELIVGNLAHIFLYEAGGAAALGGVHTRQVQNQKDGTLKLEEIKQAIRSSSDAHQPLTRLVTLENTHNTCDGISLSAAYIQSVADLAHEHGLKLHIDGARIFNAAADQDVTVKDLASPADSITFCLSKGLAAPVGSMICGTEEFIGKVHRIRKQLGGGMRQAGVLAAAGIVSFESVAGKLKEDHRRAKTLAQGLAKIPQVVTDPDNQHTNMVYFSLAEDAPITIENFLAQTKEKGLLFGGRDRFRMVTHLWITDQAVEDAVQIISEILS
ncbi:MAG: low-specificity L-threonine aldolase [Chloroflexota bacterium]